MFKAVRFAVNLLMLKGRLKQDRLAQEEAGYLIADTGTGLENNFTYKEGDREITILADFTWSNDVLLHTDSLRKWTKPYGETVTEFDYQKVLNRVTQYLSCW